MRNILKVKKIRSNAILPKRATQGSAGFDLCACIDEAVEIKPNQKMTIPTGIAISIDNENLAGMVFARSGLSVKHGIGLSNGVGVIDSDYRGEILVGLYNHSSNPYKIQPLERIAQLVIMPIACFDVMEVETLDKTYRDKGGFGSTGQM